MFSLINGCCGGEEKKQVHGSKTWTKIAVWNKLTYGRTQSIDYYKQKELKYIYMKEEIESVSNRNSTCKESVIGFSLYLLGK
jgi:hypothetical protein